MEGKIKYSYHAFEIYAAADESDPEFLVESIDKFTDMGAKLHSVIPKTVEGTTVSYMVIMEFSK